MLGILGAVAAAALWSGCSGDSEARPDAAGSASADGAVSDPGSGPSADAGAAGATGGFTWDQTHVDTQWLFDADANDDLTIEKVTHLDAGGEGSLRAALEASEDHDHTLIVFEVGGVIDYEGTTFLRSRGDHVYIAGQTAPYPGITVVHGGGLRIHGSNTIVQHMTFLPGDDVDDPDKSRALTFDDDGNNNIADRCTVGWAPDTNLSFRKNHENLAVINSIIAEPLNDSSHHEAPHGYSIHASENNRNIMVMGSLVAHGWKRNPMTKHPDTTLGFINNYVYNWGARHYHGTREEGGGPVMDWIGNVSEAGPDTELDRGIFDGRDARVYFRDQLMIPSEQPIDDERIDYADSPHNLPAGLSEEDIVPASELREFLAPQIGSRPAQRDPHSERLIDEWLTGGGGIIDHHDDRGGYPDYEPQTRELDPPETNVLDWLQQYTDEVEGIHR